MAVNDGIDEEMVMEEWAVDDVNLQELDGKLVKEARAAEIKFVKDIPVYEERDIEECWSVTGKGPVSTRWID